MIKLDVNVLTNMNSGIDYKVYRNNVLIDEGFKSDSRIETLLDFFDYEIKKITLHYNEMSLDIDVTE